MWVQKWTVIFAIFAFSVVFFLYAINRMRWENRLILRIGWRELDGFTLACAEECPNALLDDLIKQFGKRGSKLVGLPKSTVKLGREIVIYDFTVDGDQSGCRWAITDDDCHPFLTKRVYSFGGYMQLVEDVARDIAFSMGEHRANLMRLRGPSRD